LDGELIRPSPRDRDGATATRPQRIDASSADSSASS